MSRLTQKAKGMSCIRCGGPDAYACHYNGPRQLIYGKGRGIKCNDLATAEFCHNCDEIFTEGSMSLPWLNKWERSEEFLHYVMLTNIRRLNNKVIEVK